MFEFVLLTVSILGVVFLGLTYLYMHTNKVDEGLETVSGKMRDRLVLEFAIPKDTDLAPVSAEEFFESIHEILINYAGAGEGVSLEIASNYSDGIKFYIVLPGYLLKLVEAQIYMRFPGVHVKLVDDYTSRILDMTSADGENASIPYITSGGLELESGHIYSIKTFRDFEVDPLETLAGAMSDLAEGEEVWVQFVVQPVDDGWKEDVNKYAERRGKRSWWKSLLGLRHSGADETEPSSTEFRNIEQKLHGAGYGVTVRIIAKSYTQPESEQLWRDVKSAFQRYGTEFNTFVHAEPDISSEEFFERYRERYLPLRPPIILNATELATLYHLPSGAVRASSIHWANVKKLEPPVNLPGPGDGRVNIFGMTDFHNRKEPFGIKDDDLKRHMVMLGKESTGKSAMMKGMFIQDILRGMGGIYVALRRRDIIDLLDYIPENRLADVVYVDMSDDMFPVGYNILDICRYPARDALIDGVVEVLGDYGLHVWGPRIRHIVRLALQSVLYDGDATLFSVQRILLDPQYRRFVVDKIDDPVLKKFWEDEFVTLQKDREMFWVQFAPVLDLMDNLSTNHVVRNILGQTDSTLDFARAVSDGRVVLFNLAYERTGMDNAIMFGRFILLQLLAIAQGYTDSVVKSRPDFHIYIDEFPSLMSKRLVDGLSDLRKADMALILAGKHLNAMPAVTRNSLFERVGTMLALTLTQTDAHLVGDYFGRDVGVADLAGQDMHSFYVRMSIDGVITQAFSGVSSDYKGRFHKHGPGSKIIDMSRVKYTVPRSQVDRQIERWIKKKY